MNRSSNLIGELTKRMLVLSAFAFGLSINDIGGSQVMGQSIEPIQVVSSSRRDRNAPQSPVEDIESDEAMANQIKLDTPSDSDDPDSEDDMFAQEDAADEDAADEDAADEDAADDDNSDDDDEPKISPLTIQTDTRSLRVNIAETNAQAPSDLSEDLVFQGFNRSSTSPSEKLFAWVAPDIRYQPLYFEDVALERYGQTPEGCELRQTVLSAAHFFGSAALLPYKLFDQHRHSCDGPLGFCRPGSDTPFVRQKHVVR